MGGLWPIIRSLGLDGTAVIAVTLSMLRKVNEVMIVLGIESTAHTFGVGVVQDGNQWLIADERSKYVPKEGGIHPKKASQHFMIYAPQVIAEAIRKLKKGIIEVDAIAVALGPGLGPCLRVGATLARGLAAYFNKPLVPVNHAVAHVEIGRYITGLKRPLVVYLSGGNTLIAAYANGKYRVFGETLDIALGNFMDVFSREAGLGPPYVINGEHVLDICANKGKKFISNLPYVVKGQDISLSGLLTSSLRMLKSGEVQLEDLCYSVREIAYSSVIEVAERGLALTKLREVMLVGGVGASTALKSKFELMAKDRGVKFVAVPPKYAVDNGVMIALTGLQAFKHGVVIRPEEAYVRQRWRLDEVHVPWLEG